jgi:VanZ family protein
VTPRVLAWVAVGLWAAFQLVLTSIPGADLPPLPGDWFDKLAHGGLYLGLGGLVARAGMAEGWGRRGYLMAWGGVAVFGGLDEAHQLLVPGRSAEFFDWVSDVAGSGLGLAAGRVFWRRWVSAWQG